MKFDFITIGGATEDITFYTKDGVLVDTNNILKQKLIGFEYGAKLKVDKAHSTFGGGAANAAVNLAYLDFGVATIVAIGEDSRGAAIVENFKKNKVDTSLVQIEKKIETGFSFLIEGQGSEHVVFSNRAANSQLKITNAQLQNINQAKWVYMTSLSGKWTQVLDAVFKSRAKIAWNPGHIQLDAGYNKIFKYLTKTSVLSLNKDEAIELVHSSNKYKTKDKKYFNNTKNLLTAIKEWGVGLVLITSGIKGADAYDGIKFYHQEIIKEKKRVDTTGCGDAYGSSFVAGLEMFNGDIQKSMWLGAKVSSSVISYQGAQNGFFTRAQVLKK